MATESWPPNIAKATALLRPRGVAVVADADEPPLPFVDDAFDLVAGRHPVTVWWAEVTRVLRPGGTYFSQQERIEANGPFVAHSTRFLIEAREPT